MPLLLLRRCYMPVVLRRRENHAAGIPECSPLQAVGGMHTCMVVLPNAATCHAIILIRLLRQVIALLVTFRRSLAKVARLLLHTALRSLWRNSGISHGVPSATGVKQYMSLHVVHVHGISRHCCPRPIYALSGRERQYPSRVRVRDESE